MAREARERRITGMHGFRPGCGVLRQQERVAMEQATGACRELANAWSSSGLATTPGLIGLPDWLAAAMDDQVALPAPIPALAALIQQAR
jgi:hypothetical protein